MDEEKKFKCSGDCMKCQPVQWQYCAAQHSHNVLRNQQSIVERLELLEAAMLEMSSSGSVINPFEAAAEDTAQSDAGADE